MPKPEEKPLSDNNSHRETQYTQYGTAVLFFGDNDLHDGTPSLLERGKQVVVSLVSGK